MSHPHQRETLLTFLREHADSRGKVKLSTVEIHKILRSGFDLHDVAKTAQDLKRHGFVKVRVKKIGSGTRGRTMEMLYDFQLLPRALTVRSEENQLVAEATTVMVEDANFVRRQGTLVKKLDNGQAEIRDTKGSKRVGRLVTIESNDPSKPFIAWPTRGVNIRKQAWYQRLGTGAERAAIYETSEKRRIRTGNQYRFVAVLPNTQPNQDGIVYGWDRKGQLFYGPVGPTVQQIEDKVREKTEPNAADLLPSRAPIEIIESKSYDATKYDKVVALLNRESDVLIAVEGLERIGRKDLADQILAEETTQYGNSTLEGQVIALLRELGVTFSSKI